MYNLGKRGCIEQFVILETLGLCQLQYLSKNKGKEGNRKVGRHGLAVEEKKQQLRKKEGGEKVVPRD